MDRVMKIQFKELETGRNISVETKAFDDFLGGNMTNVVLHKKYHRGLRLQLLFMIEANIYKIFVRRIRHI
jgi:hypothetical protein